MNRPLKVAFVVNEFPLLSETFVLSQMVGLMARGFAVSVVCDRIADAPGIDAASEPFRTLLAHTRTRWPMPHALQAIQNRLPGRWKTLFTTLLDAMFDARLNRFDLVVAHFGQNGLRLARSRRLGVMRRPFFTIFHGYDVALPLKQGRLGRYATLFRSGQKLLPVSEYFRDRLVEAGADAACVRVLRMGVDCAAIPHEARGPRELHLVSVCRLVEKKGIAFALQALGLLRQRRPELHWRYVIIGDGPLRAALEQMAERGGIAARTEFLGAQPHAAVKSLLQTANAFLLPSVTAENGDMEGVPVALMEAMAAGLPVVSTRHSGIPELIEDGISGLLAVEGDAEGLSRKLEWLADHPEARPALTQAARAKVEAEFDQSKLDDRLADWIRQAVAA